MPSLRTTLADTGTMPAVWSLPEAQEQMQRLASDENRLVTRSAPSLPMRGLLVRRTKKANPTRLMVKDENGVVSVERGAAAVLRRWQQHPPSANTTVGQHVVPFGAKQGRPAWTLQLYVLVTRLGTEPEAFISRAGLVRSEGEGGEAQVTELQATLATMQDEGGLDEAMLWDRIDSLVGTVVSRLGQEVPVWQQKDRVVPCSSSATPMRGVLGREAKLRAFQLLELEVVVDANQRPWLTRLEGEPLMVARQAVEYEVMKNVVEGVMDVVGTSSSQQARGPNCPYLRVRSLRQ